MVDATGRLVNPSAPWFAGVRTVSHIERGCRPQGWHPRSLLSPTTLRMPNRSEYDLVKGGKMFIYTIHPMPGQKAKIEGDTSIKYRVKRVDDGCV